MSHKPQEPIPKPPPKKVPSPRHVIRNVAHSDRVADLYGGDLNGFVIGFHYHDGANQKWIFEAIDISKSQFIISTAATASGNVAAYASNAVNAFPNEVILGTLDPTIYTIKPFDAKKGIYRISFEGAGGKPLYWTLKSDEDSTKVVLEYEDAGLHAEQLWYLEFVA